jgi:DNA invertase Pin-like site-specific DNA recombinase
MNAPKFVAYLRVSTSKQNETQHGISAQRTAVKQMAESGQVLAEFVEVESGKNDNRIKLAEALELCKRTGAVLLIAKLDRLSRSVKFLFELKDSGVQIRAADVPEFNTITLGILAVMAQYERERTAERTKAALAEVRKVKGEWRTGQRKDGTKALNAAARTKAANTIKAKAELNPNTRRAKAMLAMIKNQPESAELSLTAIAAQMNASGFATASGRPFNKLSVFRLMKSA